jgi:hypothetical protein
VRTVETRALLVDTKPNDTTESDQVCCFVSGNGCYAACRRLSGGTGGGGGGGGGGVLVMKPADTDWAAE